MRDIYWFDQYETDLPSSDDWLTSAERTHATRLQVPQRRTDWLLGRWTAKCAVAGFLDVSATAENLANIVLVPGPDGAPVVHLRRSASPVNVSISHRDGCALCVVASSGHALGCDLERLEPHSEAFVLDYFTKEERWFIESWVTRGRTEYPAILWSAKEAVLKLLHVGLRMDTRAVSVRLEETAEERTWNAFRALSVNGTMFRGWWQRDGDVVRTIASFPPAQPPLRMHVQVDTAALHNLPFGKIQAQHAWHH